MKPRADTRWQRFRRWYSNINIHLLKNIAILDSSFKHSVTLKICRMKFAVTLIVLSALVALAS